MAAEGLSRYHLSFSVDKHQYYDLTRGTDRASHWGKGRLHQFNCPAVNCLGGDLIVGLFGTGADNWNWFLAALLQFLQRQSYFTFWLFFSRGVSIRLLRPLARFLRDAE